MISIYRDEMVNRLDSSLDGIVSSLGVPFKGIGSLMSYWSIDNNIDRGLSRVFYDFTLLSVLRRFFVGF